MALGCWITLLVLAFDTFVQQIVAFGARTDFRLTTSNTIPFATTWNGGEAVGIAQVIAISGMSTPCEAPYTYRLTLPARGRETAVQERRDEADSWLSHAGRHHQWPIRQ